MSSIYIKKGCIYYYENPAGYVKGKNAVVDTIFETGELKVWLQEKNLSAKFCDGVFDRLFGGEKIAELDENVIPLRKVRIWQLKADSDFNLRFISLDECKKQFGKPQSTNYELIYDGELATNDLEKIYNICNNNHPHGYKGHSLSISDVVELYDDTGSSFYYVDTFRFKEISFQP